MKATTENPTKPTDRIRCASCLSVHEVGEIRKTKKGERAFFCPVDRVWLVI